jgi:succinate dehydrogenase/fumarate reductase flavoprotein subunit
MMGSLYPSYQSCASGERKQIEAIACDGLVIGSGAAGLTTAITAHHFGADVLVVEKHPHSAPRSGGWRWVPGNPLAPRSGVDDSHQDEGLHPA